jgi:hypothetical protein
MRKQLLSILLVLVILFFCLAIYTAYSQVPVPIGPGVLDHQNDTPIGGMAVLAALGGTYAIKKLWDESA